MKKSKKLLFLKALLALLVLIVFHSLIMGFDPRVLFIPSNPDEEKVVESKDDTDENKGGLLAVLSNGNSGLVSDYEGYWSYTRYSIYYDKTIEVEKAYKYRSIDYLTTSTEKLSDYEYKTIVKNLKRLSKKSFNNDGCDGDTWYVTVYDKQGEELFKSGGYAYGYSVMESNIIPILQSYAPKESADHPKTEDMPGLSTLTGDSNQLYFYIKHRFGDDDSIYDEYNLYFDGTIEKIDCIKGNKTVTTKTIEENNLQVLQFYQDYLTSGDVETSVNDGYEYIIYDHNGNIVSQADFDTPINNTIIDNMTFELYIPHSKE